MKIPRFVIRLALNCTARRNYLPEYKGRGCRPKWGEKVRSLSRTRLEREIGPTPADKCETIHGQGRKIEAQGWSELTLPTCKPSEATETFTI